MTDQHNDNPYSRPETQSVSVGTRRTPGPLAIMGIVLVSLTAAGCAFFCSCIGLFVAAEGNSLGITASGLLIACTLIAFVAAGLTAWGMTALIRRVTRAANPRPDKQRPAE